MKTAIICAFAILCIVTVTYAGEWFATMSTGDLALASASSLLLGVDWAQTRYTAAHPQSFSETNAILGVHPSLGAVNTYFGAVIPLFWLTAWALPPKEDHGYKRFINREYFSISIGLMELGYVGHNARIGVGMRF